MGWLQGLEPPLVGLSVFKSGRLVSQEESSVLGAADLASRSHRAGVAPRGYIHYGEKAFGRRMSLSMDEL